MSYDVYEWCPYCEAENHFEDVEKRTMILNCKTCGRPLVLCDKCDDHTSCGSCKHCKVCEKQSKKWQSEQIGKIVYWKDPDDEWCSSHCLIIGFNEDGAYILRPLFSNGGIVESFGSELEFLTETQMIEQYIRFFKSKAYKDGRIKL